MNNIINSNSSTANPIDSICPQHLDKLSNGDREILKYFDWPTIFSLSQVDKYRHKILSRLIRFRKPELETFIDFRLPKILQKCMASNFNTPFLVNKAAELASQFYETKPRGIKNNKYGIAFNISPELLYYAMFLAKNEIVLEVAGASGENSALLAFSGAKRVYMNDIVPEEVESFKSLCHHLPTQIQVKLEPILGNCFDLLQLKPELKGKVGLFLCNNLLHFLNDEEHKALLQLLKTTLKPGGRAIFTVNSCYAFPNNKELYDRYPDNTAWQTIQCFVQDYFRGGIPVAKLYDSISPSTSSKVSVDYQQHYLWVSDKQTNYKWVNDESVYDVLPHEVSEKIKQVVNENLNPIKEGIFTGSIRILTSIMHLFNKKNFSQFFKDAGFEVEKTFLINGDGHIYFGEDPYGKVSRVGIIIKAPNKKA